MLTRRAPTADRQGAAGRRRQRLSRRAGAAAGRLARQSSAPADAPPARAGSALFAAPDRRRDRAAARHAGRGAGRRRPRGDRPGRARRHPARRGPQGGRQMAVALLPLAEIGIPGAARIRRAETLELLSYALRPAGFRLLLAGGAARRSGRAPAQADDAQGAGQRLSAPTRRCRRARANQRATDENVPIERADGLPSVSAPGTVHRIPQAERNSFTAPDRAFERQRLAWPCRSISGGAVQATRSARRKTRVEAGQADLRGTESAVFSQVVARLHGRDPERGDRRA